MERPIKIFKSFEEQEEYFLEYFFCKLYQKHCSPGKITKEEQQGFFKSFTQNNKD